jgi:hypothetical protein
VMRCSSGDTSAFLLPEYARSISSSGLGRYSFTLHRTMQPQMAGWELVVRLWCCTGGGSAGGDGSGGGGSGCGGGGGGRRKEEVEEETARSHTTAPTEPRQKHPAPRMPTELTTLRGVAGCAARR